MRTTHLLFGTLLTAGVLSVNVLHAQAAPSQDATQTCGKEDQRCVKPKPARVLRDSTGGRLAKAAFDREVCNRLPGQVERDTCLNHVEARA